MTKRPQNFNDSAAENPLINPPALSYGATAFDKIKTEHLEPALDWAMAKFLDEIEAIKNNQDAPSFENTIEALETAGEDLSRVVSAFHTLASNNADDEIRALEDVFDAKLTPVSSDIAMDEVLFTRIKSVYDAKDKLSLDTEQTTLLDKMYKDRVRSGALLGPQDKARLKTINTEMAQLTTKFSQNVVKHTAAFERIATKQELEGVPERALKAYKAAAEAAANADGATAERKAALQDKYLIRLQPHPGEIMTHCKNRALRQEINEASGKIGREAPYDNSDIVMKVVALRHEKAQLLGYKNHADFVLSERMAGSPKAVEDFLSKNLNAYKPKAKEYFESVRDFALASGEISDFQPYDFAYYDRQLEEKTFSFDTEKLRPYFELNKVFEGFRQHIEKLFNVEMTDCSDDYPAYRDDAKVYEVKDKKSGEILALFYTDYYADAETKRGGAWMNQLRQRCLDKNGVDQIPLITNSCNYQKPTKDQPTLLSLGEVTTLFHEGGHGFHGALGKGRYGSLTGTSVKWDFVELPSQLQENWVTQKEVLDTFAHHYETGAPIPQEYIDKIHEMETYGAAYMGLRQTMLGLLDMLWHNSDPATIKSVDQVEDKVHKQTSFWAKRNGTMSTRFGHLFSDGIGYSAGYYSYKWAEVLDADVFEEFKRKGLYDPATAKRLRETIYEKGGTEDPMGLFKKMMGRAPDPDALFRREGLKEDKGTKPQNPSDPKPPMP